MAESRSCHGGTGTIYGSGREGAFENAGKSVPRYVRVLLEVGVTFGTRNNEGNGVW